MKYGLSDSNQDLEEFEKANTEAVAALGAAYVKGDKQFSDFKRIVNSILAEIERGDIEKVTGFLAATYLANALSITKPVDKISIR